MGVKKGDCQLGCAELRTQQHTGTCVILSPTGSGTGFRSFYVHPFTGPPLEIRRGLSQTHPTLGRAGPMWGRTGPGMSPELPPPLLRVASIS